jgi:hypothetical protein
MSATKTQLLGGHFQDLSGNVLANGYLRMFLSSDELVTGVGFICSGIYVQIQLDSNGSVASSTSTPPATNQFVWSNDVMTPVNSYYRVFGYTANGQLAFGPDNQQVVFGAGTFDVGTWVPNSVISWQPPIQPLTLQVNGANNGSQTLLDLTAGSGVTLVDNGSGGVTISAGGSTTFDVNSTPLTSSSTVNFQSGTGITVTNPSAGNILITATNPVASFPSGANVAILPVYTTSSAGLNGFTVVLKIPAGYVEAFTTAGFKVGIQTAATTGLVVNSASIGKTLPGGSVWTSGPTAFTFPGGSFASANTIYFSNTCALVGDANHDYYITVYFDPSSASGNAYVQATPGTGAAASFAAGLYQGYAGWLTGNHTADADATSLQTLGGGGNIFCIQQVITA